MKLLVIRFLIGGAVVTGFSLLGDLFKPKSFAGLFGAAPSIALATLALAVVYEGKSNAAAQALSMGWMHRPVLLRIVRQLDHDAPAHAGDLGDYLFASHLVCGRIWVMENAAGIVPCGFALIFPVSSRHAGTNA